RQTISNQGNAECLAFAIYGIGELRYERAVLVLTKFLEFRWPVNARQKQRLFVLEHDGKSIYPAATALEQLGKNALPSAIVSVKRIRGIRTAACGHVLLPASAVALRLWQGW